MKIFKTAIAGVIAAGLMAGSAIAMDKKDIVDTAAGNSDFETLVAAVQAAGLVDTLKGEGPFTVFAPTDAAFGELDDETLNLLLSGPEGAIPSLRAHVTIGGFLGLQRREG